jgi:hypothetical protein
MNLLNMLRDARRISADDRKARRRRQPALDRLEVREVLSAMPTPVSHVAAVAASHLLSGPPAEVRAMSAPASNGTIRAAAATGSWSNLSVYNNLSVDLHSVTITHFTEGGGAYTLSDDGTIKAGQTIEDFEVLDGGGDRWSVSATYRDPFDNQSHWVTVTLASFTLSSADAGANLYISFDTKTNPAWYQSNIDCDFYIADNIYTSARKASYNAFVF